MHARNDAETLQRLGMRLVRGGYALAVLLAALALFGSIGMQLWGAPGALDGAGAHRHQVYCEASVWTLRRELQEMELRLWRRPRTSAARQVDYPGWQTRLTEVRRRCADLPAEGLLGERLAELGTHAATIDAEAAAVLEGPAKDLDFGLNFLHRSR